MKILTGQLRGRVIPIRPGAHLRPTADKARKAICDMLCGGMEGKNVLDLFSGTGALGMEALSNGAEKATFVEADKNALRRIGDNLKKLGLFERSRLIAGDVLKTIPHLEDYYDFIFSDPPYERGWTEKTLAALSAARIWHEDTLVVAECHEKEKPPDRAGNFKIVKTKVYGDSKVIIYQPVHSS
ncbi:MAG: 16S rRNA (guanine(966)-N(2))-methyltransferase RsmD [Candidatus Omnitrophica bacterium]|nr:16S rRNA (guanine(966)-N(2))-methyltransferase RsmD [Candidatus Omnitrophota bacterium]